jgi:hypothetical protein
VTSGLWIEMPVAGSGAAGDPVRAKYTIEANAFLVHRGGKVYVMCPDQGAREATLRHADCRQLTPLEVTGLEEELPFPVTPDLVARPRRTARTLGLGDAVTWVTRKLGMAECDACRKRRRLLNRVAVWGWWRRHAN